MKQAFGFIILIFFTSCQYFEAKKTTSEAILNEELKTFNWDEVDVYPSFSICDSLVTKATKRACFEHTLSAHILNFLQEEVIVVTQDVNDTITLNFKISEKGAITLNKTDIDSVTLQEIPNLKVLINNSLQTLPKVYAAIKRDQYVKTTFTLPIIIGVE
ncbi:hypothetical protein FUA26_09385 [Seonamhaeicola algicola]|uniref:TonB C-terminal domain-containing protein n=1 Tax=Seonamhaeicola algicola TaxID=1719036 RepID=A0A5C7AMZ3_9FLAO|nr:hypothetical protein [Seonamhaeicola algicola]TXE09691.1 hypothetical protein FUA26_09385 [Seonamhaeicola algicola]